MSRFDLFFILVDECNEVTDYAIARKIVDLHTRMEQSVERIYSIDEIQRYLTFARLFKPTISKESQDYIVEQYKTLRQRDVSGITKSSWRITVRQLESMIRLSEALARLHCQDEVQPKHVREAFRLLNKSIIRVETPDIQFEEEEQIDDDEHLPNGNQQELNRIVTATTNGHVNGSVENGDAQPAAAPRRVKLSYEQYKRISQMITSHMRQVEDRPALEDDSAALRRSDVVNWYLKDIEGEIDSEAELEEKTFLINRVLDRLIKNDGVILALREPTLTEESLNAAASEEDDDPYLVVHPNYSMES